MAKHIRVAAVSVAPFSVGAAENAAACAVAHMKDSLAAIGPEGTDIIVLPELCDIPAELMPGRGDGLFAYLAERGDSVLRLISDFAKEHRTYIAYNTLISEEGGALKNATRMIDREGRLIGQYDKCYVTAAEAAVGVVPGNGAVLFDCDFGKVGAIIGIDAEEKEIRRRYKAQKPDLMIHATRRSYGLAEAFFAYNTRSYLVSACPLGMASAVLSPVGETVAASSAFAVAAVATVNIDFLLAHGDGNGSRFPLIRKKYADLVPIYTPANLGAHMITVEAPDLSADDIIKEFELEPLDAFLDRATAKRRLLKAKE